MGGVLRWAGFSPHPFGKSFDKLKTNGVNISNYSKGNSVTNTLDIDYLVAIFLKSRLETDVADCRGKQLQICDPAYITRHV